MQYFEAGVCTVVGTLICIKKNLIVLLSVLAPLSLSSLKEDILRHRLFIDSDQMPTWVHYCFCLIMQLVYIPAEAPPFDCGSFLIGRTFFVNMYAYVFMAFLLSISGMFICDRHFQNIFP